MVYTEHSLFISDSRLLDSLHDESVDLVVTSPPYPMIEMWDGLFIEGYEGVRHAWDDGDYETAFECMHRGLDRVWVELHRVLRQGGVACINVGDATRRLGQSFRLFPNHARILMGCRTAGFHSLPLIHWRKPTNAPNKFMGSGMLPAGAYVTLEHEYILLMRKGGLRRFTGASERQRRVRSALFWEERNSWYSDVWEIRGVSQVLNGTGARARSGAFPFEIAYRLISMYSVLGDWVLDPFFGTGTTALAAAAACRNSVGVEIDEAFGDGLASSLRAAVTGLNEYTAARLGRHLDFVDEYTGRGNVLKHQNLHYGFPVMTAQEKELLLSFIEQVEAVEPETHGMGRRTKKPGARPRSVVRVVYAPDASLGYHREPSSSPHMDTPR
jgi:DNA modification methylase